MCVKVSWSDPYGENTQTFLLTFLFGLSLPQQLERRTMAMNIQSGIDSQEQLVDEIKSTISDAEDMLNATADQAGDKVTKLRARVQARLQDAKVRLVEAEELLIAKTKAAAKATDVYVHESPWTSIGVGCAVGVVVGLLIGSNRR